MLMLAFILRKGFDGRNYTGEAIFIGKDHVLTEGSLTPEQILVGLLKSLINLFS